MTCSLALDARPRQDKRVTQRATVAGTTLRGLGGDVKLVGFNPRGSWSKRGVDSRSGSGMTGGHTPLILPFDRLRIN